MAPKQLPVKTGEQTSAFPSILLLGTLWGTNLVISRFGVGQMDPLIFVGLRLTLATFGFATISLLWRRRWTRNGRLWKHATLLGVAGTAVPMSAVMSSLRYQSSGVTALLITTTPALIVLLAHIFLPDERLNRYKGLGVVLALTGAMLLIIRGESGLPDIEPANPIGYLLVFVAMIAESSMAIYVRTYMRGLDAYDVTNARLLTAALVVMPLGLLSRDLNLTQVDGLGLLSLGYSAFVGALAGQLLAFQVTKRFGATSFSLTAYIIPVVATLTGVVLLGEQMTPGILYGMVLIGAGITLINKRPS